MNSGMEREREGMEGERRDGGRGFIPSHLILVCEAAELVVLHQLKELSSSQEYLRKTLPFTSYSPLSLSLSLPFIKILACSSICWHSSLVGDNINTAGTAGSVIISCTSGNRKDRAV